MNQYYSFISNNYDIESFASFYAERVQEFVDQYREDIRPIVDILLNHYSFYDRKLFESVFDSYIDKMKCFIRDVCQDDYILLPAITDSKPHNSYSFYSLFKNQGLENITLSIDMDVILTKKHIIIVDDFSGSGGRYIEFFEKYFNSIQDEAISIHFIPLFITEFAISNINNHSFYRQTFFDTSISIICGDGFLTRKDIISSNDYGTLSSYCNDVLGIKESRLRGHGETECLITFPYFTPNNTVGLFWNKQKFPYFPLFNRDGEQEPFLQRKRLTYKCISIYNECLKCSSQPKMKAYLLIAVMMHLGYSVKNIKSVYLCSKSGDYDAGVKYLRNKKIINSEGKIDIDEMIRYVNLPAIEASMFFTIENRYSRDAKNNLLNKIIKR